MVATRAEFLQFKRLMLSVLAVIVLLVTAILAALLLVDTELIKNRVETRVEAATGRELRIEGPLEISVFPWLGFEVGGARLANAPGFGDQPFVAVDRAELRARALPLLRGEVVLDTVVLHGLRVNAARNSQGQTNWAGLVPADPSGDGAAASPPADGPAQTPEADASSPPQSAPLSVRVAGVEVRDARLAWNDAVNDRTVVLRGFEMTMNAVRSGRPSVVLLNGTLDTGAAPPLAIGARMRLNYDLETPSATLSNLTIGVDGQGRLLPPGLPVELTTDLHVDGAAGTVALERLVVRALGIVAARGTAHARFGDGTPAFEGHLAVEPFSPAALAKTMGWPLPERSDPDALQKASLSLDFSGTPQAITVEPLEATLDETEVSGQARARLGDTPTLEFALAANTLNLDRYLPAPAEASPQEDGGGGAPAADDPIAGLPLETLQGVGGSGQVTIGRLQWRGVPMEEVRLEAKLADGVVDLTRADMLVAGGRIGASGQLDATDASRPAVRANAEIAEVQSQPLMAAFLDTAPVTGRLNTNAKLSTAGATLDAWIDGLNGNITARFTDGAIKGINIAQRLRVAAARLRGDPLARASETRATDFSSLRVSATITEGIARSEDLELRTPLLRVGGDGWVDLGNRTLDYTARILVTGTLEGQGGASGAELSGAEIPLHFSGAVTAPEIELVLADVLEERARQQLEQKGGEAEQRAREQIEEEVDEAGERIEEELRDQLEGVFE